MNKEVFKIVLLFLISFISNEILAQVIWTNVDAEFAPLPKNFHVYKTTDSLDGKPFIAYYAEAKLKDKKLQFSSDTTFNRRFTPQQFFEKNNQPLLVVNCTFFSFATNKSLNVVVKDGKLVANAIQKVKSTADTSILIDKHLIRGAIGISKKRKADVAWIKSDSSMHFPLASQVVIDNKAGNYFGKKNGEKVAINYEPNFAIWKMKTAVGGGPVLVQKGAIKITNNEEGMFTGKAINDKHPRTCMGYTSDGRLIIMVIAGRQTGIADGATLTQQAQLLINLGCVEALNLDGGGSSCMLINGKPTIQVSDKEGQRAVPAVFLIK